MKTSALLLVVAFLHRAVKCSLPPGAHGHFVANAFLSTWHSSSESDSDDSGSESDGHPTERMVMPGPNDAAPQSSNATPMPLLAAFCLDDHFEAFKALLASPAVVQEHLSAALLVAVQHGRVEFVRQLLLDARVDPSAEGDAAIRLAAKHGHAGVVALLLTDPRVSPQAPLAVASLACYRVLWLVASFDRVAQMEAFAAWWAEIEKPSRGLLDVLALRNRHRPQFAFRLFIEAGRPSLPTLADINTADL